MSGLIFVPLALLALLLAPRIPLELCDPKSILSSYGVHDNRALLLRYWGVLAAVVVAPFLALLAGRWWPSRSDHPGAPSAPAGEGAPSSPPTGSGGTLAGESGVQPRSRRLLREWLFGLAVVAVSLLLFVGPGIRYRALNGHELAHLGYLSEMEHGRMLNVETRSTYGPLLGYTLHAFMKLTSFTVAGFRLYWNVITALTLAALILLARPHWRSRLLFALMVGCVVLHTSARHFLPDARGIHAGFWGWGNILRHGWPALLVFGLHPRLAAGPAFAAAALGGAAWLAAGLYATESALPGAWALLALLLSRPAPTRERALRFLAAAGGAIAAAGLILAPVLRDGQIPAFLHYSTLIPRLYLRGLGNSAYLGPLDQDRGGLPALLPYYLLPAAVLAVLFVTLTRRVRAEDRGPLLPLALYAGFAWTSVLVRADIEHLLNATLLPTVVLFLFVDRELPSWQLRLPPLRVLAPLALALPLALAPGVHGLAAGVVGRLIHPLPAPPPGLVPLPLDRAGIWVESDSCWYDNPGWGAIDDPAAVAMVRRLAGAGPIAFRGNRSSLMYFLSGVPANTRYTDQPSQCLTRSDYDEFWREYARTPATFVFTPITNPAAAPGEKYGYRQLGARHGYFVSQRLDLAPVQLDP